MASPTEQVDCSFPCRALPLPEECIRPATFTNEHGSFCSDEHFKIWTTKSSPAELAQDAHDEQMRSEFPGCPIDAMNEIARLRQEIAEKDREITTLWQDIAEKDRDIATLFDLSTEVDDGVIMFCCRWCLRKITEKRIIDIDEGGELKPEDEDARCRAEYELYEKGGILH
jgi:hypothetical protein